ncbi:hypothetical protein ACLOJK_039600 [Asimina triloba]
MEPAGGSDTSPLEDFVHVVNPDDATTKISVDESNPTPCPSSPSMQLPDGVAAAAASAAAGEEEDAPGGDDPSPVREPEEGLGRQRAALPEELAGGVVVLECESSAEGGSCQVCLVGTAHVSRESCREVQAVIRHFKPQVSCLLLRCCSSCPTPTSFLFFPVVFLELCSSRVAILTPHNLQVADKLEVLPGSEFRVAFEEAMCYGAKVVLGDRPVQLKEMDDVDMLTLVIQEMSKEFPTLMETLLHERDLYMSSTLLRVASEHASVVAVVGKGHLQGIKKHWKQPVEVKDLLETPANSGRPTMSILKAIGVAATGVAIISGIYLASKR